MKVETQVSSLATLPHRAKGDYTNNFRTVQVLTNHYQIKLLQDFEKLYIFSIRFDPKINFDNRQKRKEVIQGAWQQITANIKNPAVCGMNLISNKEPSQKQFTITVKDINVSIKLVKELDTKNDQKSLLFFLNNRFRNVMGQIGYSQIGRTGKYFNLKSKKQIDNLNMYSGFKANFVLLQKGIFLRVDSAKKIVRNQTVLQFIDDLYKKHQGKQRQQVRGIVKQTLKNQIIQVNYGNGKYYKIEDIIYKDLKQEFMEKTNIISYYKDRYGIKIQKQKQPLLKVQNKKGGMEILLVPELCLMTGIPDDFDQNKRKKISQHTILDARTKQKQINYIMDEIKKTEDFDKLKNIGINLNEKLYKMKALSIPTPMIALGENRSVQQGKQAFFNLFNDPIFSFKHKVKLAIMFFRADLRDMIRTFENTTKGLKVEFEYEKYELRDQRRAIEQISKNVKRAAQKGSNICLIVIPPQMKSQYKRIKQACLIENKMVCQVACEATLRKKNAQSIATKVLLQIIAKRGNTLWCPQGKAKLSDIMLAGIDNAAISGGKNVLAACGTVNKSFTSIYSKIIEYTGLQEKFVSTKKILLNILNYYVDRNKAPPKEIILYCNSCSGDQVRSFKQFFIDQFLKQAQEIYKEKCPNLQVIMVNTKTSQRFFSDQGENVRAGTLISTQVVSKDYDFYLVSQNSNRGCIVPNHYKVIFSNSKMEEGILAELTFNQCFNYVNWSGSIKIPGILQYAKKCAKFNSEVLEEQNLSESLERCLYFV